MYPELRTSVSPDEREHLVLESWKEKNIFKRSVEERDAERVFSFYEGPPTVNGTPGIHHVFSRTIKDAICRYKTMSGFRVERKAGWDTHGLPVEIAIEKELGFRHKNEIVEYGVGKFNEKCKELVYSNISRDAGWRELTERMGYWVNMDDPYITCTNDYVESVWWAIKKFHDARLIYKGFKIQPYCPRCETALSTHEVAQGYKEVIDPTAYVKFKLKNPPMEVLSWIEASTPKDFDVFFLVWTTTPWTLVSNVGLAVKPDANYSLIRNRRGQNSEYLILAHELLNKIEGDIEFIRNYKGHEMLEWRYEPLFTYDLRKFMPLSIRQGFVVVDTPDYKIVAGDFVTMTEGTGIVHIAPAFGEEDFEVGKLVMLPLLNPIDNSGRFVSAVQDLDEMKSEVVQPNLAGLFFKEADPLIFQYLKQRGLLYRKEMFEHKYPFCWRCDTPLMYTVRDSWYIHVTDFKQKLIEENKKINWQPPEIQDGRFGNWLEELKDWGLSRERFWGTPLPIWVSPDDSFRADRSLCIGNFKELLLGHEIDGEVRVEHDEQRSPEGVWEGDSSLFIRGRYKFEPWIIDEKGIAQPFTSLDNFDPHKLLVDQIEFREQSGRAVLRRTPEVIDVWFDSGSMPFAQHHYMRDGETGSIPPPPNYPADFISEGIDQTRGWFYTMHAINTFLFGERAYKNVIVNDMLLDKKGQKMSKSKGNIVDPFAVMTKHGADATRWYLLSAAVPWKPRAFNEDDLGELERKLFGTLTNTYGFFALYANIDSYAYDAKKIISVQKRAEVDRWILSKLNSLVKECREELDAYDLTRPARAIQEFVMEQLSNWYIRRNRRRFWKGEQGEDKQAAYDTLYECLLTISKLMAPLAPFFSDWMYQALSGSGDSVHLAEYPAVNESAIDAPLEKRMESAQIISSLVRQMRERAKLRIRQPLSRILIPVARRAEIDELRKVEDVIREEVNVKKVEYVEAGDSDVIKLKAKANFKSLGAKLGAMMKAVAARVQKLSQDELRAYQTVGSLALEIDGTSVMLDRGDIEIFAEDVEGWLVSSEGAVTVALDTAMTPELLSEGMAREFVNRVQNLRKDSGFDVTDRIAIFVTSESSEILDAVTSHADFIKQETLATAISTGITENSESALADFDILGLFAKVGLERTR